MTIRADREWLERRGIEAPRAPARQDHPDRERRSVRRRELPVTRSCGGCQACCVTLGVEELSKAAGHACSLLCTAGCSVYDGRPQSCRDYTCLWLAGNFGSQRDRPDRLGVIADMSVPSATVLELRGKGFSVACLREVRRGALESKRVRGLRASLARQADLVVLMPIGAPSKTEFRRELLGRVERSGLLPIAGNPGPSPPVV